MLQNIYNTVIDYKYYNYFCTKFKTNKEKKSYDGKR